MKKIIIILWLLFLLGCGGVYLIFSGIASGKIGYMPPIEELENPKNKFATIIYSCDSVELGRFSQAKENRVYVDYNSLSPYLIQALVATEDERFVEHSGIDVPSIYRALFKTVLLRQRSAGGGSTITQQLAKNLFLSGERSWERKFKELAYALLMEHELGKDRILELYLNYAQWGKDIFGCQEACLAYYKKSCSKLSVDQAINLAAMLASPGKHHPNMRESQFMAKRRAVIYQNMFPKKDSLLVDSLRQLMAPPAESVVTPVETATPVSGVEASVPENPE